MPIREVTLYSITYGNGRLAYPPSSYFWKDKYSFLEPRIPSKTERLAHLEMTGRRVPGQLGHPCCWWGHSLAPGDCCNPQWPPTVPTKTLAKAGGKSDVGRGPCERAIRHSCPQRRRKHRSPIYIRPAP